MPRTVMSYAERQRRIRERREERRVAMRALKDRPCADCHQRYPYYVMQFDHISGEKLMNLARLVNSNCSLERVLMEAEKCEVVCANCHAIRTWERQNAASA